MRIFVGVYWGPRQEDVSHCAARLVKHFAVLKSTSIYLAHWYKGDRCKPTSDMCVNTDSISVLDEILRKGVNRRDIGREPMPELGFTMSLTNGEAGGWSAGTAVKCGLYSRNRNLSNAANLSIEFDEVEPLAPAVVQGVLRSLVEIWEPSTGRVEQNYVPLSKGRDAQVFEDVLYASYWTSGVGERGTDGQIAKYAQGQLWISDEQRWRDVAV